MKTTNAKKDRNSFSDYFWFNRWMLQCCGVLPQPEKGFLINLLLILLTLVSISFLVFPGLYTVLVVSDIEYIEKINFIGESVELLVSGIKGKKIKKSVHDSIKNLQVLG